MVEKTEAFTLASLGKPRLCSRQHLLCAKAHWARSVLRFIMRACPEIHQVLLRLIPSQREYHSCICCVWATISKGGCSHTMYMAPTCSSNRSRTVVLILRSSAPSLNPSRSDALEVDWRE